MVQVIRFADLSRQVDGMNGDIEIVGFSDRWAKDFARLNYEWIEAYFAVERHDRDILDDPWTHVIDPGGEIFIAIADGEAVGAVAMIPAGNGVFELTKMAVSPMSRGRGIGDLLMARCIRFAYERDATEIFLETHSKLGPAIALYRKHGFAETPPDPNSQYARADVRMELAIERVNM